jgi:hypothetical protein
MYNLNNINFKNVQSNISFTSNVNESYTSSALSFMQSINEENNENLATMAKNIVNGMNITEAANLFCKSTEIIIDKSTDMMGKMINSFTKELDQYFSERKQFISNIESVKDRTDELAKSALTIEGFFYTEMKQPNILLASEFKEGYSDLLSKSPDSVFNGLSRKYMDSYLDKIRAKTILLDGQVSYKLFRDKVFGFYRNNTTKETIAVYKEAQIADIIRKYLDHKVYIENLNELYEDILSQASEVKRCIELLTEDLCTMETINNVVYGKSNKFVDMNGLVTEGFNEAISAITKKKMTLVQDFMAIYLLLVSDKISAMKSSINQNTVLLDSFYNMIMLGEGEQ